VKRRGHPRLQGLAIGIAALAFAGCGPRPTEIPASPTFDPTATVPATTTVVPTPLGSLAIDVLPQASFDAAMLTTVCDPEAAQATLLAGDATVFCSDGLLLGLRALQTLSSRPFTRLYFRRPVCKATPCTADELGIATVMGSSAEAIFAVRIDSRLQTIDVLVPDGARAWPPAGLSRPPAVARPDVGAAPAEITARVPYPFCGKADLGDPTTTLGCFRDAVVAGRPAELVQTVFGTEGGTLTWLYRFDGRGAVTRYAGSDGKWQRQSGTLILGITPLAWDFDPWPDTDVAL
jgi:hypothetical protein